MTHDSYDQRMAKLRRCLEIAQRVGNTFLADNLKQAIRELENSGRA